MLRKMPEGKELVQTLQYYISVDVPTQVMKIMS